jgi:acetolactate synthase I/II/III large subunit
MTSVGEALIAGLRARGVDVVFGIPGVHTVELYRGLAGSGVRHVTARHEQGAAFMADGYARVSGKPGVALVITGPGLTNALTAMAQAKADSVPMLVISGVNRRASLGKGLGLLHELPDQAAMVGALCPTRQLTRAEDLGAALDWAFATMASGRPGPVHIEIPTDVMPLPCPVLAAPAGVIVRPLAEAAEVARAAKMLNAAGKVVILAGGGALRAGKALRAVAKALDAPVVQTVNARGVMLGDALSVPASPSLLAVRKLIAGADLVLAVGTELGPTDYDMNVQGGVPDLSGMIRVDVCQDQLARHKAALAICADAGAALEAVLPMLKQKRGDGAARAELVGVNPVMPGQLAMAEAIREALPGAIIVGDSTQPVYAGNLYYEPDRLGGWFNAATGYGALGYGPGAAVGAAMAAPHVPVVCLIGDGGLQFSPGELRTAVDEGLQISFVVWNNAGFREIAEAMAGAGAKVIGCDPSPLKMQPFAAACDLPFVSVANDPAALRAALEQLVTGPRMIEVRVV